MQDTLASEGNVDWDMYRNPTKRTRTSAELSNCFLSTSLQHM